MMGKSSVSMASGNIQKSLIYSALEHSYPHCSKPCITQWDTCSRMSYIRYLKAWVIWLAEYPENRGRQDASFQMEVI